VKPLVRWPGGKTRLLKHLLPLLPEHTGYVEVFGGGAALLLAKPRNRSEIYNDLNGNLVNLFRVAKFHPNALREELALMPFARAEFKAYIEQPGLTDIQRAARWVYRNASCFGGEDESLFAFSITGGGGGNKRLSKLRDNISLFAARFDGVAIDNRDWRKVLAAHDRPTTLFFLDPPYMGGTIKSYSAWTLDDMRELKLSLTKLKGKWLLTVNNTPELREMFAEFEVINIERPRGIAGAIPKQYAELIIRPRGQ
jgi:DNA adenine methylase